MALRVLLADESTTIKRVMQLALQDFAVEVKAVPIGVDVVPVSKAYKPDIIFADVLLPKKSGYEVSKDLKKDPETKNIPVVLMWSGFMEIDEVKAKESMAERRLEKPFEPETLRSLVLELVKKTQKNPVSSYLNFPTLPDFQEDAALPDVPSGLSVPPPPASTSQSDISITASGLFSADDSKGSLSDSEEIPSLELPDDEEFSQVPLHKATIPSKRESISEDWSHQDLSQFKMDVPVDEPEQVAQKYTIPSEEMQKPEVNSYGEFDEITFIKAPTQGPNSSLSSLSSSTSSSLPSSGLIDHEALIRDEARKIIESIAWKILPEITERIVREEINKLLQDTEKSISVP